MNPYCAHKQSSISPDATSRALQRLFGEETTNCDTLPALNLVDWSNPEHPIIEGKKPLNDRIEYQLLSQTPKTEDGHMAVEDLLKTYRKLTGTKDFRGKLRAELAGARIIAAMAFEADVDVETRRAVKIFIISLECEINTGGHICGGRHSVLVNSANPKIDEINNWLNGRKVAQSPHSTVR